MRNILIIDTEAGCGSIVSALVKGAGYQPLEAHDCQEGLQLLAMESIAVVVMDLCLVQTDGNDLLQQIKHFGAQQPVIIFTGHSSVDSAIQALRLGGIDYLVKPYHPASVEQALRCAEDALTSRERFQRVMHELRSPLAAMHMDLQLLTMPDVDLDGQEREELLADAMRRTQQLLARIDSLDAFSIPSQALLRGVS